MAYNEYQKMHYTAMIGNQQPNKATTTKKEYALYEGKAEVLRGPYPLLVHRKQELARNGHRFLKIKPIKK